LGGYCALFLSCMIRRRLFRMGESTISFGLDSQRYNPACSEIQVCRRIREITKNNCPIVPFTPAIRLSGMRSDQIGSKGSNRDFTPHLVNRECPTSLSTLRSTICNLVVLVVSSGLSLSIDSLLRGLVALKRRVARASLPLEPRAKHILALPR
jgi:hypothetical protein